MCPAFSETSLLWPAALGSIISSFGQEAAYGTLNVIGPGSNTLSSTIAVNSIHYMPVCLQDTITVANMGWLNGSVVAGNLDVGIADEFGNKIISTGSTAQAGTTAFQTASMASTLLLPGNYYLVIAGNNASSALQGRSLASGRLADALGMRYQTGTFPIPSSATWITSPLSVDSSWLWVIAY